MKKLKQWQDKHCISTEAMNELSELLGLNIVSVEPSYSNNIKSEAAIQTDIRLAASHRGWRLYRNNVGVAKRDDGTPVRYGLANESKKMNESVKSSDLIGIRPILITPEHIGTTIGQFVALEVKKGEWFYTGSERELAQLKFQQIISNLGGYAKFINNVEDL